MVGIKKAKMHALIHLTNMCAGPAVFRHRARGSPGAPVGTQSRGGLECTGRIHGPWSLIWVIRRQNIKKL